MSSVIAFSDIVIFNAYSEFIAGGASESCIARNAVKFREGIRFLMISNAESDDDVIRAAGYYNENK